MSALAAIRPDEGSLPLFLHLIGSMALVGALVLALAYLAPAWRGGSARTLTLGFRSLLFAAVPAFVLMRATAQWLVEEQGLTGDEIPTWVEIGHATTDAGVVLLVIALAGSGLAARRARRAGIDGGGAGARLAAATISILLVAYLVTIWAMTAKPA